MDFKEVWRANFLFKKIIDFQKYILEFKQWILKVLIS